MKHPLQLLSDYKINRSEAQLMLGIPYIEKEYFTIKDLVKVSIIHKPNKLFLYNRKLWCHFHLKILFANKIFESVHLYKTRYKYRMRAEDKAAIHKGIFEWYAYSGDVSNLSDLKIVYIMFKNKGITTRKYLLQWVQPKRNSLFKQLRRLKQRGIIFDSPCNTYLILNPKLHDFLNV